MLWKKLHRFEHVHTENTSSHFCWFSHKIRPKNTEKSAYSVWVYSWENRQMNRLTEEVGELFGLVVVHSSHTQCVESHQTQHGPVKRLRLHYVPDEESQSTLLFMEGRALQFRALQTAPCKRRTWRSENKQLNRVARKQNTIKCNENWNVLSNMASEN